MRINDKYKVEAIDERNIALIKIHVAQSGKQEGQEIEKIVGYYSDVKSALKSMCKKEILGTGLKDLETVMVKIEELYNLIESLGDKYE